MLNFEQKKYLKKNAKYKNLDQLSEELGVTKEEIERYLIKKWGSYRYNNYLSLTNKPLINKEGDNFEIKIASGISSIYLEIKNFILNNYWYLIIISVLGLLVYLNALGNEFVSDDIADIKNNPALADFNYVTSRPFGFIRPLWYYLVYNLLGPNPIAFRSVNLLFHMGASLALFGLLQIFYPKKIALVIASIFAVHPILIEAVTWISGGSYAQYAFFFLLSFICYVKSKANFNYFYLSIVLFTLATISHSQMALPTAAIFFLYELCFGKVGDNFLKILAFFGISFIWALYTLTALPERVQTLQSVHYQELGYDNPFILLPIAISSYLELIFFPINLTLYHSELSFSTANFIIRSLITLSYLGLIIYLLFKNKKLAFWLIWPLIILSPTLTPFRLTWLVAERYAYLASIGIITTGVLLASRIKLRSQEAIIVIVVLVISLLGIRTVIRNFDWSTADNLWLSAEKTSPSSPNNHNNLGDLYGRRGDTQRAIQEFQTAIALKPNYADAYHNLGNTYSQTGDLEKALFNYQKAIEFNPNLWQSYQNIASIYFSQKKYPEALDYMQKAINVNPQSPDLYYNLGVIYLESGDKEKAKEIFTALANQFPDIERIQTALQKASE